MTRTYHDEVDVQLDDGINIGGDVDVNETEEINVGLGEDSDNSVNGCCDISCGGRRG